jgi:hypothetical protein
MRTEIKIFCIKIIDRKTLLVSYILSRTVIFSMLRVLIRYLLSVIFCDFFDIFPICRKVNGL